MWSGMWSETVPSGWSLIIWRRTTSGGHVQSYVTSTEASWSRFSFFSATLRF